jgi:Flp pilus assembly protein CpaB
MTACKSLTITVCLACVVFFQPSNASFSDAQISQSFANKPVRFITVLVATRNLAQGAVVKAPEKWFVDRKMDSRLVPKESCCRFDEISYGKLQRYVKLQKPIGAGQVLTHEHIREPSFEEFVSKNYPGRKPFTFRALWWGNGCIYPMDQIHIFLQIQEPGAEPVYRIEMERVLVLNCDFCNADPSDNDITLLVTVAAFPEQVEQLTGALSQGKLRIVLSRP